MHINLAKIGDLLRAQGITPDNPDGYTDTVMSYLEQFSEFNRIWTTTKRCSQCKVIKDRSLFHADTRLIDGLSCYCKECRKINDAAKYRRRRI